MHDDFSAIKENTTVLIITHASKNVAEQGIRGAMVYPGAPNTTLLDKVFENIKRSTGLERVVISFDHKVDCSISRQYLSNLREFCLKREATLMVSPTSLAMHNQLTATAAFLCGIRSISTKYVLFFEHDHLFLDCVDWRVVGEAFAMGLRMLRFNLNQYALQTTIAISLIWLRQSFALAYLNTQKKMSQVGMELLEVLLKAR